MISLLCTQPSNPDFLGLVKSLDAFLAVVDGDDHAFYDQFNNTDALDVAVVVYANNMPLGCGAFKKWNDAVVEIKRMWVEPTFRNRGIASQMLTALENMARESGFTACILETGIRQPDAIALYQKNGYRIIENYGQYAGLPASVCFEKAL